MCIFCKIINKEIPSKLVFENEDFVIINDINPQANIHYLLILKEHFENVIVMNENQGIKLIKAINTFSELVEKLGLIDGFRLVSNCGKNSRQTVNHLHIHILGGEMLSEKMA